MAGYTNPGKKAVGPFSVGGKEYTVPPGGSVQIPDKWSYAVQKRGLPLVPTDAGTTAEPVPETEDGILWQKRAHEERARADEYARQLVEAQERVQSLSDSREELSLRATHADGEAQRLSGVTEDQQKRIAVLEAQLGQAKRELDQALAFATAPAAEAEAKPEHEPRRRSRS